MPRKLTDKQQLFVIEYLKDLNGTQAAIRTGYSERSAKEQASRLLTNDNIQEALQEAVADRLKETKVDANYVLDRLVQIDKMDVIDILDEAGSVKPISDWPECWRRTISGIDINEINIGDIEAVVKKIKWPDKVKNLELIGKHVDVQAWKEKIEHSGVIDGLTDEQLNKKLEALIAGTK